MMIKQALMKIIYDDVTLSCMMIKQVLMKIIYDDVILYHV